MRQVKNTITRSEVRGIVLNSVLSIGLEVDRLRHPRRAISTDKCCLVAYAVPGVRSVDSLTAQRNGLDSGFRQRLQLTRVGDAILVQVPPDLEVKKSAV